MFLTVFGLNSQQSKVLQLLWPVFHIRFIRKMTKGPKCGPTTELMTFSGVLIQQHTKERLRGLETGKDQNKKQCNASKQIKLAKARSKKTLGKKHKEKLEWVNHRQRTR